MIELCPAGRGGTPVEVATVGALLMRPEGASITGSTSSSTAELPRPTSTANSPLVRRNLRGSATNRVDRVTFRNTGSAERVLVVRTGETECR
jgi:hypothetical protein